MKRKHVIIIIILIIPIILILGIYKLSKYKKYEGEIIEKEPSGYITIKVLNASNQEYYNFLEDRGLLFSTYEFRVEDAFVRDSNGKSINVVDLQIGDTISFVAKESSYQYHMGMGSRQLDIVKFIKKLN